MTERVCKGWRVAEPSPTVFNGERYVSSNDMDGAHLHDPERLPTRRWDTGHHTLHKRTKNSRGQPFVCCWLIGGRKWLCARVALGRRGSVLKSSVLIFMWIAANRVSGEEILTSLPPTRFALCDVLTGSWGHAGRAPRFGRPEPRGVRRADLLPSPSPVGGVSLTAS